jgi:SAM-dependent methyltransferase
VRYFPLALKGQIRKLAKRLGLRRSPVEATPTNWQDRTPTQAEIDYQVEYGVSNGEVHLWRLQKMEIPVAGSRLLEIGPGIAFGNMAYLLAAGAEVAVCDRWLTPWSDAFHGPLYSAIAERLAGLPGFDVAPLRRMVAQRGYSADTIRCLADPAERLASARNGEFDAIISNAVLEHIERPERAFQELWRVTRPGGIGLHQVDFRDHRDFSKPLEHLLMMPAEFADLNRKANFEFGSQRRQPDYARLLVDAGFRIERYESNDAADDAYLDGVMNRLGSGTNPAPLHWTRSAVGDLSGLFWLRKPS